MHATTDLHFVHEALLYAGEDEYLARTVPFVLEGVAAGEPVMVALPRVKLGALQEAVEGAASEVLFVDMDALGSNPACILPAWQDFLSSRAPGHRPARGIGEPIGPDRSPGALLEAQHHEVLLDHAFATRPNFWLVCPYDTSRLAAEVVEEAGRSHRYVAEGAGPNRANARYEAGDPPAFGEPLPDPTTPADCFPFDIDTLMTVRRFTTSALLARGLPPGRLGDALVAVNELATNSVCHGGGRGTLRVWEEPGDLVCEVTDTGTITEPLVGRRRPASHRESGRGLWIVNQLADLVELRSGEGGTTVRLHLGKA